MTLWLDNMCLLRTLQFLKKKPNYECKLAGNLNHPLDNMFFCQNWIPSPQCVSGICFNKTNLSKAPKFEMKRIWEFLNHSRSTLLQDFLIPRIQGTKSHIGQWDQPAGGNVASHTLPKWPTTPIGKDSERLPTTILSGANCWILWGVTRNDHLENW